MTAAFDGKIQLVVFDMDGVLVDVISSWKHIHDYFNTSNQKSVDAYLRGTIDDLEFIKRDVSLWKENGQFITKEKLTELLSSAPLMNGAQETVALLQQHGVKTAIISAGLALLAHKIGKEIGIDHVFANDVKIDAAGRLTGEGVLGVKLMYKDEAIAKLSKKTGIPSGQFAAVGNSCFDIPMFEQSGLGIAFNPSDDCVRDAADFIVEGKNLIEIYSVIKPFLTS